ncbi:MAG: endolytic transglycosylase MltG [Alphaproteobacteria bacterium]|nr:endolytic transglycosylase MltG [Alphaproteobacteria bacterium]
MIKEEAQCCLKGFAIGFLVGAVLFVSYGIYCVTKDSDYFPSEGCCLIVDQPSNLSAVSELFVTNNISSGVHNSYFFTKIVVKFGRLLGYRLKFGEYDLPVKVSLWDAIKILSAKEPVLHKICIPEGFSVHRTLERINNNKFLQGEITEIPEEGSLMPDTYCFRYPTTKQDIIDQAQKAMSDFLKKEWPNKSEDCFLETPQEVLILASIVEKESNIELETIAGMYFNRLRIGMKLQACPTAIYARAKGQKFPRNLTIKDLKYDHPYNTYVHKGLPPGPISNPGKKSILAVLHPKKSNWLYLYYDGRRMSKPVYSKTYQEHRENIARIKKVNVSKVK